MANTIKDRVDKLLQEQTDQADLVVGKVVLHVDYQIIEHFSQHLYDSPNKAVEELAANSFDAFATEVHVFTPGPQTTSRLLVWDNGESMDIDGLKKLWWLAKSPKTNGDRVETREGKARKIIGKFGIGKLASYTVGEVITHICRHNEEYYLVSIDYSLVHGSDSNPPVSTENPITAPIVRLKKPFASEMVESLFDNRPPSLEYMLAQDTWTLAVVERLKIDALPIGRLMWVLGNGMPLRPDFSIWVNEEQVTSRIHKEAAVEWNFGSTEVVDAVKTRWKDAESKDGVSPIKAISNQLGLDASAPNEPIPFIEFAHLGLVWGYVRLFDETLLKFRSADHGRSHGFFLVVRGRLMNPDDEQLFLPDPSFQTFYRAQFIIYADDLDSSLLADRQRLRHDEAVVELRLLQRALASVARTKVQARDDEHEETLKTRSILPISSRLYFRDPLNALLTKAPLDDLANFDPVSVDVERRQLGVDEPISVVALKEGAFHVNTLHPYYSVLEKRAGHSRAAAEFLRTFDLFAISERLLEGHLLDMGITEIEVSHIIDWREGLFRRFAVSYDKAPEIINKMYTTSYTGGAKFENALSDLFVSMGFASYHDGSSGKKDILVLATVGPESYSFAVEAKGSKHDIGNQNAQVGAAANHRDQVKGNHALIVARKFVGFSLDPDSQDAAILEECRSTGGVSIMEVDALEKLHAAITEFSYPLSMVRDVLFALETPTEKLSRISSLVNPFDGFDYSKLLDEIWTRQGNTAKDDVVAYRSVFQEGGWKDGTTWDDFQCRLIALDTLAAGRIKMNTTAQHVYLRQSPDLILDQISKSLYRDGHDIEDSPNQPKGQLS